MSIMVCDLKSKQCIVHHCKNCPRKAGFIARLNSTDITENDEIEFKQWQATDHTSLNNITYSTEDFIKMAASKLDALTAHSNITKSQAQYLKNRKANLQSDTTLILANFSKLLFCNIK